MTNMLPSRFMVILEPNLSPCLTNSAICVSLNSPVIANSKVLPSSSTDNVVGREQLVLMSLTLSQP